MLFNFTCLMLICIQNEQAMTKRCSVLCVFKGVYLLIILHFLRINQQYMAVSCKTGLVSQKFWKL